MLTLALFLTFTSAWAQEIKPEVTYSMESAFYLEYSNRPTSEEGESEFNFSDLEFIPTIKVTDEFSTTFWAVLAGQRATGSKKYTTELENAFITYQGKNSTDWIHELGLIRPLYHRYEGINDEVEFFGQASKSLAERYNFLQMGDLGYQGRYVISEESFAMFGAMNGEENASDEVGASKELFAGYIHQNSRQLFALWLSYGQVDPVDEEVADRGRAFLRYQRHWGRFTLGLEGMWAQDPSADYENNGRAENMTFTELTEPENISTEAGRVDLIYRLNDQQLVLLRYDHLRPELKDKDIQSFTTAWVKAEKSYFSWGLFYENTLYGTEHSTQSRQRERVLLGMTLHF